MRFRKRPVVINAVQWDGKNGPALQEFAGEDFSVIDPLDSMESEDPEASAEIFDRLHNTWVLAYTGDWIIQGVAGEFYPCRPDVFAETYEEVEE